MSKYLSVFKISFQQELVYKINFIMWRVRTILQIFFVFFLWDTVFSDPKRVVFGYDKAKILTYIFGIIIIRAFVMAAKSEEVAGEVAQGTLSNYLIKPVSYFKYWLARDISNKSLNLIFASVEAVILYLVLRPPFFIQTNPVNLLAFVVSLTVAALLLFSFRFIVGSIPFWVPEAAWGFNFIFFGVIMEFLSGAQFPLDILPGTFQSALYLTPFPYLVFFPLQVYLGTIPLSQIFKGIVISVSWLIILRLLLKSIWNMGLKVYQAHGR